jgi:hypothetical protein
MLKGNSSNKRLFRGRIDTEDADFGDFRIKFLGEFDGRKSPDTVPLKIVTYLKIYHCCTSSSETEPHRVPIPVRYMMLLRLRSTGILAFVGGLLNQVLNQRWRTGTLSTVLEPAVST